MIQRRIGVGGMGEVYLAEHQHIGRKAAIKVLLPELSSRPDVVSRFFNEARATGLLRHPCIVEILDCAVHESGRAYLVMEFLAGETLGHCLGRIGSFEEDTATVAAIVGQLAAALAAAHGKGIVHRDLKPENTFLAVHPDGEPAVRVKILDFGIAKLLGEGSSESQKTRTGSLLGTPLYMSPEQCRGAGKVDHRTDVYSLGCILFELLAGRPPFVREGHGELIIAHVSEPPPDLALLVPSTPAPLADLVARMLAKDPVQRVQAMSDVVLAIEDFLGVPASQFAGRMTLPPGFPPPGEVQDVDALSGSGPSNVTPYAGAPNAGDFPSSLAGPVPRTLVQVGQTKVLPGRGTTLSQAAVVAPETLSRPPSRPAVKIAIGAATLAVVGLGGWIALPAMRSLPPRSPVPIQAAGYPEQALPRSPAPPQPHSPAVAKSVTIDLEGGPEGLRVTLDGKSTTAPVSVPAGSDLHELRVEAPGFKSKVFTVNGAKDKSFILDMQPVTVNAPEEKLRDAKPIPTPTTGPSRGDSPAPSQPKKRSGGFTKL